MIKLINKFKSMTFEEKTIFSTKFSCLFNALMAISKIFLSFFYGIFFLVAGIVNIFTMLSKLECYLGVKYPHKKTFEYRNNMIGIFLILAGIEYSIYMTRMLLTDFNSMEYSMFLGINIALISFIEMGIAIKGCFNAFGKGHYFRNMKLINLCSAFTAMVLTEIAITSFASEVDTKMIDGIFGICVGGLIILIAGYILVAPKISIVDREHNVYKLKNNAKHNLNVNNDNKVIINLTSSPVCGNYTYEATLENNVLDGHIIKGKSPIWKWNIWIKILIIVLSEILIFVYAVWSFIFHIKCSTLINKLDNYMEKNNFIKVNPND